MLILMKMSLVKIQSVSKKQSCITLKGQAATSVLPVQDKASVFKNTTAEPDVHTLRHTLFILAKACLYLHRQENNSVNHDNTFHGYTELVVSFKYNLKI